MNELQSDFYLLGVSFAIGLLIGAERGWADRDAAQGRIAGLRTYGLIGLLGGVAAILSDAFGLLFLGLVFIGLAAVLAAVYVVNRQQGREDAGITSLMAALLTLVLGAAAALGYVVIASSVAVITALLLGYKANLHRWLESLEQKELLAGIHLLLITVVLLPVLPNQGYGPWQALNPYQIWWMVVLVAGISFLGYFAIKIAGTHKGIFYTSIFGGMVASTAITLHFSRAIRQSPLRSDILQTGILMACSTVYPRLVVISSILHPPLFLPLLLPMLLMALFVWLPGFAYFIKSMDGQEIHRSPLRNPLELKAAVIFGAYLAILMLFAEALQLYFGEKGILWLAAVSGIIDVDAITLSLASLAGETTSNSLLSQGIILAASVNSLAKALISLFIAGFKNSLKASLPLGMASTAGFVWVFLAG